MTKALVILSGGIDSTVLLYDLIDQGYDVEAITFHYGQKHSKEISSAKATCAILDIPQKIVRLEGIEDLIHGSALIGDKDIPEGHYEDESMKSTVVANRNSIFINLAMAYAITKKIRTIAYGAHAGDHAIYPDCRPVFVERIQALAEVVDYDPLNIIVPYLHWKKQDIVKKGAELGVDFDYTWSCYKGQRLHCGRCGTCVERIEAFKLAGVEDPTKYMEVK